MRTLNYYKTNILTTTPPPPSYCLICKLSTWSLLLGLHMLVH